MKNYNFILALLISLFILCLPIHSQDSLETDIDSDTLSNYFLFNYISSLTSDDYFVYLDSIKNNLSNDYFTLRMAYTKTEEYSPYDSEISDTLKKVTALIDSQKYNDALIILENIQEYNFVNILSHLYSGYTYELLGDSLKSEYHYNIYDGLLNSIYESGDGMSVKNAYIVINTKEEYNFLNWFDLQCYEQNLIHQDGYSFDLMKVKDRETNEGFEVYFNVSLALIKLNEMLTK